jgi:hypothetical protein
MYSLLKESGYFEMHDQIGEIELYEALNKHLECVDQWLTLSESKRVSSGWYFEDNTNGTYSVGYYPQQKNLTPAEYFDKVKACAAFIKREIEDIRVI